MDSGHCPLLVTSGESPSLQVSRSKKLSREASPRQSPTVSLREGELSVAFVWAAQRGLTG